MMFKDLLFEERRGLRLAIVSALNDLELHEREELVERAFGDDRENYKKGYCVSVALESDVQKYVVSLLSYCNREDGLSSRVLGNYLDEVLKLPSLDGKYRKTVENVCQQLDK